MADSDSKTQRPSNFYDSPYLAEYYDLWVDTNKKALNVQEDAAIYLSAVRKSLETSPHQVSPDRPFTVLDVGTGTGRVVVNLANDSIHAGLDLSNVELIGVDNEPAMIQRAKDVEKETASMAQVGTVTWALGEAVDLTTSVAALQNRLGQVDILIFAVGSISHLVSPDEPQRFLSQVATLLRRGSGRAYLPIQNDLISRRSITQSPATTDTTWAEVSVAQDFASKLHPGIIYKQYPVEKSETNGPIKTDQYRFHVVRKTDSGEEKEEILENNKIEVSLRIWDEAEFIQWARDAGLECVETFHSLHETYYVLKLSGDSN
jgi:SAM-dependent methyltransferase